MRATLHNKIIGLVLMGTMLPVIVIVLVVLVNYRQTIGAIDGEIDQLVRAHLGSIARDIRDLCDTTNEVVQARVDQNLVAARKLLNRAGGAKTPLGPPGARPFDSTGSRCLAGGFLRGEVAAFPSPIPSCPSWCQSLSLRRSAPAAHQGPCGSLSARCRGERPSEIGGGIDDEFLPIGIMIIERELLIP